MDGDGLVAQSSLINLEFCCLCYCLYSEEGEKLGISCPNIVDYKMYTSACR